MGRGHRREINWEDIETILGRAGKSVKERGEQTLGMFSPYVYYKNFQN
jgi:hypothetical protein